MKRILSLVLVLVLVLGTMTTAFAGNLDLINTVDSNKSYSYSEIVQSPVKFGHVGTNPENYLIEFNTKFYKLTDLIAATAGGDSIEDAVAGLTPVTPEEPEELTVVSVSAINATTLLVTMNDGNMHQVVLENGQELEVNVDTVVSFAINGVYYTANVTLLKQSATGEQEIVEARAEFMAAKDIYDQAAQELVEAKLALVQAEKYGTQAEIIDATAAVMQAQITASKEFGKMFIAGQKLIDAIEGTQYALDYEKALAAVEKAERSRAQVDVTAAQTAINKISDPFSDPRVALQERLDVVKAEIDAKAAVELVEGLLEDETITQVDINWAKNKVDALEDGPAKTALLLRLEAVQDAFDVIVRELKEAAATVVVEAAEANVLVPDWNNAQLDYNAALPLVEALEDGPVKDDLLQRLADVQAAIDEAIAAAAAEAKVADAEYRISIVDYVNALIFHDEALILVNALEAGTVKDDLLTRLDVVAAAIQADADLTSATEVWSLINAIENPLPAGVVNATLISDTIAANNARNALNPAALALVDPVMIARLNSAIAHINGIVPGTI